MRRRNRGNTMLEAALWIPVLMLFLIGMVQFARITYIYYTLRKTLYSAAQYVSSQQGVNFCDPADTTVQAALNFALTGTTDGSGESFIPQLTADMITIQAERYDADTQQLGDCDCSVIGCDAAAGGGSPDYIVVSIPDGYSVTPRIPFLLIDPIPLRPQVRIPYHGT